MANTLTIEVSDDHYWWLQHRVEALGLSSISALIARMIAAEDTEETRLETLRSLLEAGADSGVSDRSLQDIMQDHRARLAAA